jgi:hypothetical protein
MVRKAMPNSRAGPLVKLRRLDGGRRNLLIRSAAILSMASLAVALLPFRRAIRFGSVNVSNGGRDRPADIIWAVEAAARRVPWRAMCIEKGLAVQRLLRRSAVDARLHYGVRHHPQSGKLEAHVWVTVGERIIIGGDEAGGFAEVASYP